MTPANSPADRPDVKYLPHPCTFLKRDVWAILSQRPDGSWQIVNCLDKDTACFDHPCRFVTDGGEWPFPAELR